MWLNENHPRLTGKPKAEGWQVFRGKNIASITPKIMASIAEA